MGATSPQHSWVDRLTQGKKYHVIRVVLFVVACVLVVTAMLMLSFTNNQLNRTQQLAANMIQTEQRAEVLLIASYSDSDTATQMQRDGVVDLLQRSSVAVDVEYLDAHACNTSMNVDDASTYGARLMNSDWGKALTAKITAHGTYSAIICLDDDALYLVESLHESLFPETPVVFTGINDAAHAQRIFDAGYATGITESYDVAAMVATAQKMRSDATSLTVLTDNTATGIGDRAQFEQASTTFADLPIEYVNTSTISRAELGQAVSAATEDTILVYLGATTDATGNAYSESQSAYFVAQAATQPVFAIGFGGVGEGFLASNFIDYELQGQRAGEIVVMVLNGTRPADIPIEAFASDGAIFDSQALSTYGISGAALPSNATMLNQSGLSLDSLRPIFLPVMLLILGIACIAAFAVLGYRRTATELIDVVTQRNMLERRFYTDHVTDMPNMQWLTAYASSEAATRVRSIVEVALFDMDKMNETRGAGTATEVIKIVAERLDGLDKMFLVRPDQNEFILGFDRELKRGGEYLDRIEFLLNQPIELGGQTIALDPCVGVFNRERGMSIEQMVAGVELTISQAETLGMAGEVIFYDDDMRRAVEDKLEITARLKDAIESDGFIVVYQPQIELATNEVVGYEALVRLRGDLYPPEQFIPVAEENGQIIEIDRIVTKKVVLQLATWKKRKQRMRPVSINTSAGYLRDDHFVRYATALLDEHGLSHDLLRVDIEETLFLNNMAKASGFIEELRAAGFGIAIDSFGAGYTSISHVMQIPADVVKIDRSLTAAFLAGNDDDVIANLVRLVHGANKIVVIEGVETIEQLKMCREMDCDVVQGFLFSEPLLPEQAVRYKPQDLALLRSSGTSGAANVATTGNASADDATTGDATGSDAAGSDVVGADATGNTSAGDAAGSASAGDAMASGDAAGNASMNAATMSKNTSGAATSSAARGSFAADDRALDAPVQAGDPGSEDDTAATSSASADASVIPSTGSAGLDALFKPTNASADQSSSSDSAN